MGLGCIVGLHRWSGWQMLHRGLGGGVATWERECLSCGEREKRYRPPSGLCDEDDHEWEGSAFRPLMREAVGEDGERGVQRYKRCQRCPAELVFRFGTWEEEEDG